MSHKTVTFCLSKLLSHEMVIKEDASLWNLNFQLADRNRKACHLFALESAMSRYVKYECFRADYFIFNTF